MNIIEGKISAADMKFAIVLSRFNIFIGEKLLDGAIDCIQRHNGNTDNIDLVKVPGAFEVPLTAQKLAETKKYDAVICLGAVIRGDTPHFDYVASEAAKGIALAGLKTGVPVIFGVLTTDSIDQAIERAGTKAGNKGWDAAISAIEMVNVFKQF